MTFKIIFPAGYIVKDIANDNIDINVILSDGTVYFGTLFTLANIQYLLSETTQVYFWSTNMLIVKDLSKSTIRYSISQVLQDEYFDVIFCKIGIIGEKHHAQYSSFDDVKDMTGKG